MAGEHAELALDPRHVDLRDLAGEQQPFRRHQVELKVCHGLCRLGSELLALLDRLLDGSDHVERGLRQMVVVAFAQALEALDGVFEFDEHADELEAAAAEHCAD